MQLKELLVEDHGCVSHTRWRNLILSLTSEGLSYKQADSGRGSRTEGPGPGSGWKKSAAPVIPIQLWEPVWLHWSELSVGLIKNLLRKEGWVLMTEHRLKEREREEGGDTLKETWR